MRRDNEHGLFVHVCIDSPQIAVNRLTKKLVPSGEGIERLEVEDRDRKGVYAPLYALQMVIILPIRKM